MSARQGQAGGSLSRVAARTQLTSPGSRADRCSAPVPVRACRIRSSEPPGGPAGAAPPPRPGTGGAAPLAGAAPGTTGELRVFELQRRDRLAQRPKPRPSSPRSSTGSRARAPSIASRTWPRSRSPSVPGSRPSRRPGQADQRDGRLHDHIGRRDVSQLLLPGRAQLVLARLACPGAHARTSSE